MSFLPSFFVIQTGPSRPYLSSSSTGNLQWDGSFSSPGAKFAAEPSKSFGRDVVHIRSCYNNKYWVANPVSGGMGASGDEPVEDTNDPGCTLYRVSVSNLYWFTISPLNRPNSFIVEHWGLVVSSHPQQLFVVDWETLVFLPSQVSLISDDLRDHWAYSKSVRGNYLRFDAGMDIGNIRVAFELFPTQTGEYRIRNLYFNRFLRNNTWIIADPDGNNHSKSVTFSFVSLGNGVFGLRSMLTNRFSGPDTRGSSVTYLRDEHQTLVRRARLRVVERVLERTISDIRYRFEDSRIHQVESVDVTNAVARNDNNTTDEMTVKFSIEESHTTTWKSSTSVTLGVKVSLRVTIIPVILKGKVEASAQVNFTQEWEETRTRTTKRELTYKVLVPPKSVRRVTLVCTKAVCDVPYSYLQHDLLPDGRRVTSVKDDGIFNGVNSYDFDVTSTDSFEDALGRMYV